MHPAEFNYYSSFYQEEGLGEVNGDIPSPQIFFYDTKVEMQAGCIELLFYNHGLVLLYYYTTQV